MALVHELTDEEVTEMLKASFIARKNKTEAGKRNYYLSTTHDHCFTIAAATCKRLTADPIVFMDAIFHATDPDKLFPNFLTNAAWCMKKYNEYIATYFVKADQLFPVLLKLLKSQLEQGRTLEQILLSDYLNFPSWFRCCITKEPIPSVMEKYKSAAMYELTIDVKQLLREKNLDFTRIYGI